MKIIDPHFSCQEDLNSDIICYRVAEMARICYKTSASSMKDPKDFVSMLLAKGHYSPLEHVTLAYIIVCDRGVSHELVRHRLASYSQESTRYCNYSKERFGNEITVIRPPGYESHTIAFSHWQFACETAEKAYMALLQAGEPPELARAVLPNSLATVIGMTANLREWRHMLHLRTSPQAHPQMRQIMTPILAELTQALPEIFTNLTEV